MARGKKGRVVSGWLVVDKPAGITSSAVVNKVKWAFDAQKAGHAGTLDPAATGVLAVALGEATKTVPYVTEALKCYRFTVTFGAATTTDDAEGVVIATSAQRPTDGEIQAALVAFRGDIQQVPPQFSAVKVDGERAYDLARDGASVELAPRPVTINSLDLVSATTDEAVLEARCSKGTYVRAIARDLGRHLGCLGHVTALRRTRVGPFTEADAIPLANLEDNAINAPAQMLNVETGLAEVPCVIVDRDGASRLRRGQPLILRGRDAPSEGMAYAACGGVLVAFGPVQGGELVPSRVFNLPI